MDQLKSPRLYLPLSFLVLLFVVLGLVFPLPAFADVGLHPILPGGSNIQPEGETPIQMAAETVTMTVRIATEADNHILQLNPQAYGLQFQPVWYSAVAEVQADFTMSNPTASDILLTTWFPLASSLESVSWELNPDEVPPRIASFHVVVDSNSEDYSVSELPNPKGTDKPPLPWASFPVTFRASTQTSIHVSYLLPLTQAIKGSELALYYVFQTGASWSGPIGQAELILNLPYPASTGTLARVLPGSLDIPYPVPDSQSALTADAVMEGNQARWTWTNFEPTAQDDFSVWLVDPALWQELEAASATVQASPQDGDAWLDLAKIYLRLSVKAYNFPSIFMDSYLAPGLMAFQKAADLLPGHPAPYVGLAILTLAPFMRTTNVPSDAMQYIQNELLTAKELEAAHPDLAEEAGLQSWLVDDSLNVYFGNITATAVFAATSTSWAAQTSTASVSLTPMVVPPAQLTATPTPSPTPSLVMPSPIPSSTVDAGIEELIANHNLGVIPQIAAVILLLVIGLLAYKRLRRNPG